MMQHPGFSPSGILVRAARPGKRVLASMLLALPLIALGACGPSRDEKLAESLAEARAAAARAEKAQKAAELALAKLKGQSTPEPEDDASDEAETVEGDDTGADAADNGDGNDTDTQADEANIDHDDPDQGEVVSKPPARTGNKGRRAGEEA